MEVALKREWSGIVEWVGGSGGFRWGGEVWAVGMGWVVKRRKEGRREGRKDCGRV